MTRAEILEGEAVELLAGLSPGSVDGIVTDPPYSSGGAFRGDRSASTGSKYVRAEQAAPDFFGDTRDQRSFAAWCALWLGRCWRAARDGAPVVVFTDWRQLPTVCDAIQVAGFAWRGIGVWDKPNPRPQLGRFSASAEFWVWGSKGALPMDRPVPCLAGTVTIPTVPTSDRRHQAEKPVELMKHVAQIVEPGGLVLDPFCGSGSTGVGALAMGRRFLGFELSPAYAAIARDRLAGVLPDVERSQGDLFAGLGS